MTAKKKKDRVVIFDTTLRDGEQCPGASMGLAEKLQVARQLARLRVDIIEAGFPIASPGDFDAVHAVATELAGTDAKRRKSPSICGLARCVTSDIDAAAKALIPAGDKARIHVFLATSAIHRQHKLKMAKSKIIETAIKGVKRAKGFVDDVQFSPEDAARTERDFLVDVVQAAIDAGATTINIPDTVGYAVPEEFGECIAHLKQNVQGIDDVVIHVHCHNDLGLAVSNSLNAIKHGARGVECTINGIGERAGNCSLEEVVMALRTRHDFFEIDTQVKTEEIFRTSRLVSQMTGLHVQRNKAIVGANAFAHEAGIHQDGMLKERTTYEIMRPEDVGISGTELVLGKHSGRHAFGDHMKKLGFELKGKALEESYNAFINLADRKKHIYDDDLVAIMQNQMDMDTAVYTLDYLHVASGNSTVPTATVRLKKGEELTQDAACGDGPVDAALKTIERITGIQGKLLDFSLQAVTRGKDALGEVSVQVDFGDQTVTGKGSSTDIVEAGARAFLNCINRYLAAKEQAKKKPKRKKRTRKAS